MLADQIVEAHDHRLSCPSDGAPDQEPYQHGKSQGCQCVAHPCRKCLRAQRIIGGRRQHARFAPDDAGNSEDQHDIGELGGTGDTILCMGVLPQRRMRGTYFTTRAGFSPGAGV